MRLEDGFVDWATSDPELPAVVAGDDHISYGQLHHHASAMAEAIVEAAGPTVARVGIFAERGPEAYAGILASLLAGASYVPINPGHPPARIARTIELADLDLILADPVGLAALDRIARSGTTRSPADHGRRGSDGWGPGGTLRLVDAGGSQAPARPATSDPDDTAYLLFTSGTTGEPKGVPIRHANVTAFLDHNLDHYRFGPGDRCSQTFDLTFDLSVFDLFMAWGSGACVHTMGPTELLAPVDFVAEHGLSVWFSVPAVAALQLQRRALRPGAMPSLRTSLFCGEALTVEVADAWSAAAPNSMAENLYGPTELTIACTRYRFSPVGGRHSRGGADDTTAGLDALFGGDLESSAGLESSGGLVPIGRPFPTMTAVVVDDGGQQVGPGVEGELCLRGPQRFDGYWRSPERTADRTIAIDGVEHYRTGDRVRAEATSPDGPTGDSLLRFVGRLDGQVQVLGHRVELGEVEAAARTLPDVVDAVAVPLPVGDATTRELGLVVTLVERDGADGDRPEGPRSIRRAVAPLLPPYMAPRRVAVLDGFPLNANGKIDRGAVARLAFGSSDAAPGRIPAGDRAEVNR